ncbi:dihydrodipicolinate synthase family protein [Aliikangiella maris]|uniref:Dihydrodipicolinate synthase family protein n=2 Tax=Aliikangiella maris TaxID=3162458 RepID=A0ABV2BVH2_9GAMM
MFTITSQQLQGFIPAAVTPFAENGEIMFDAFQELIRWLVEIGAQGICVAADNGESWSLTTEERYQLTKTAKDIVGVNFPIYTGITATQNFMTVKNALAAQNAGANGVLLMPPPYVLRVSEKALIDRFSQVSKAITLPIIIYNSPRRVGFSLTMDNIEAIYNSANIIGIKESHRDFFHHTELLSRFKNKLSIMVGPCHYIFPAIALGASGFIATGPELLGRQATQLTAMAKKKPDEQMAETHFKLTQIYQMLMGLGTWPAAFKAVLNLMGLPAGLPRDPALPLEKPQIDKLKQQLDTLQINYR